MDSDRLELIIGADQAPYWDVTTTPGGASYVNLTGYALQFVVRRHDDVLVVSKTTGASGITIGNGASTGSRATVIITDTDIVGWPAGNNYYGSLWRTDDGNDTPYWTGVVTLRKPAGQA